LIYTDHVYSEDQTFKFLKKLNQYGFSVSKGQVEHPGESFCRSLDFEDGHYLEFIHIGKKGREIFAPGISFGTPKGFVTHLKNINNFMYFLVILSIYPISFSLYFIFFNYFSCSSPNNPEQIKFYI
jgi:hypothetical protein